VDAGASEALPKADKREVAEAILERVLALRAEGRGVKPAAKRGARGTRSARGQRPAARSGRKARSR